MPLLQDIQEPVPCPLSLVPLGGGQYFWRSLSLILVSLISLPLHHICGMGTVMSTSYGGDGSRLMGSSLRLRHSQWVPASSVSTLSQLPLATSEEGGR